MSFKRTDNKPLPRLRPETRPFWEATRREEFLLQECGACGRKIYVPRTHCPHCLTPDPGWCRSSGKGTILSYTIVHQALVDGFADEVPYPYAIVELEEEVRVLTNIVDCTPEEIRIGLPVEVVFDPEREEIRIPRFRPLSGKQP